MFVEVAASGLASLPAASRTQLATCYVQMLSVSVLQQRGQLAGQCAAAAYLAQTHGNTTKCRRVVHSSAEGSVRLT